MCVDITGNFAFVHLLEVVFILSICPYLGFPVLIFRMCPCSSDPDPRGLPDGGVWRRLQPQSAEGGSSGRDGPMGRHPHGSPRLGSQPQDLHVREGAAGVSSSEWKVQTSPNRSKPVLGCC